LDSLTEELEENSTQTGEQTTYFWSRFSSANFYTAC